MNEILKTCWLLLERNGTACMSVNSVEEAIHFAAENGIILSSPPRVAGHYIFLDVNTEATNLAAFYSWAEVNPNGYPMQDAWRPLSGTTLKLARRIPGGQILSSVL